MRKKLWLSSAVLLLILVLGVSVIPSVAVVYSPTEGHWIVWTRNETLTYNDTEIGPSNMSVVDVVNWTVTMVNTTHYNLTGSHTATVTWPTEPGTVGIAVTNGTFYVLTNDSYYGITYTPKTKSDTTFTAIEHLVVNSTGYVQEAYSDWDVGAGHAYAVSAFYNFSKPYTSEFADVTIFGFSNEDSWSPLGVIDPSYLSVGDEITLYNDPLLGKVNATWEKVNATVLDEVTWTVAGQSSVDLWKLNYTTATESAAWAKGTNSKILDFELAFFGYFTKDAGISVSGDVLVKDVVIAPGPHFYEKLRHVFANATATNIDLITGEKAAGFSMSLIFAAAIGIGIATGALIARHRKKL